VVTALNQAKTYGQTATLTGYTATGLAPGDSVSSVNLASTGQAAGAHAGTYAIVASDADGVGLSNYDFSFVDGSLQVNPASIVVTALGGMSVRGASPANPGLAATGLQNADGVSALTGLANSFNINAKTASGVYPLTVAGLLGNADYVIASRVAGDWTVAGGTVASASTQVLVSQFIYQTSGAQRSNEIDAGLGDGVGLGRRGSIGRTPMFISAVADSTPPFSYVVDASDDQADWVHSWSGDSTSEFQSAN
jgi:hypothetical protein